MPEIVNVPLYPPTPTPAMSTVCPTVKPCAALVVIVTVVPDSVAVEMLAVANDLLIVGGPMTFSVAVLLVVPVPPLLELTAPVVLFFTPAVVPVTSTLIVQLLLDARLPPLKLRVVSPAEGLNVPPQPLLEFGVLATTKPAGRLSVNARPFSITLLFGFVIVKLNVLLAFNTMLVG